MRLFNLHTHTHFCDGSDTPEVYVKAAIDLNFSTLGFSGHAPMPFENKFAIPTERFSEYIDEIDRLKKKYQGQINILKSLEFDYIPGVTEDFEILTKRYQLDYSIGSVHLVGDQNTEQFWFTDGGSAAPYDEGLQKNYHGDIRLAVKAYYDQIKQMILTQNPDIIGHLDKVKMHNQNRFFTEDEGWYRQEIDQILDLIKSKGCIVEVNTRGLYKKRSDSLFPGVEVLKRIKSLHIPITISSDAHNPKEISLFIPETISLLKSLGFKNLMNFENKWIEVAIV
ncbi:MAG: histidinol phosphatase [Bacteroidetes bacterium HGW-Bacteroidetes-17]|jgi:histidinol-phosphatase (PHP family)|nr:MAG: histidinol phosphatase [Bacteroidetes bacterium HGW-Bacteroidetes-17]